MHYIVRNEAPRLPQVPQFNSLNITSAPVVAMRALEALLSIIDYAGYLFPKHNQEGNEKFTGLQLSHIVSSNPAAFSLHEEVSTRRTEAGNGVLRYVDQEIPQFVHHRDTSSVLDSWKSTIEDLYHNRLNPWRSNPQEWRVARYHVPNVTDKETVLTLAKLAANAYVPTPHEGDWSEVNGTDGGSWSHTGDGYGWDDDGIRGYVFTSSDKKTMVLSIKGTSTAVLDSGGPTAPNDKINDNLFFSCCCARVTRMWSTVCDCYMGDGQCDELCLERELLREDRYYRELLNVFANAKSLTPDATTIWITGHSLGGALASMLGRTYGLPVVTFEAPGDDLPVRRLHLPVPPGLTPWEDYVWHFGHNADPIFMGSCSGSSSTCWLKGFAMETKCHSGQVCMYDVKKDLGWHDSIVNHRIHVVIDNVLEVYDEPAHCVIPGACEDCSEWEFIDPLDVAPPEPTPTATAKPTKSPNTRTPNTKTKNSKTTSKPANPHSSTSTPDLTSSCLSRAWYGRCEEWTEVPVDAPTPTSSSLTTSCVEHNWIGQCDEWATITTQ